MRGVPKRGLMDSRQANGEKGKEGYFAHHEKLG